LHKAATKTSDIIHVTPQGVAIPADLKYRIPDHYVENIRRPGSYGEHVNEKFVERLRIDPATLPGMKGPNFSHYHLNGFGLRTIVRVLKHLIRDSVNERKF